MCEAHKLAWHKRKSPGRRKRSGLETQLLRKMQVQLRRKKLPRRKRRSLGEIEMLTLMKESKNECFLSYFCIKRLMPFLFLNNALKARWGFGVLGFWCLVLGAWCLVFGAWCLVFGAWCLVFGAWWFA